MTWIETKCKKTRYICNDIFWFHTIWSNLAKNISKPVLKFSKWIFLNEPMANTMTHSLSKLNRHTPPTAISPHTPVQKGKKRVDVNNPRSGFWNPLGLLHKSRSARFLNNECDCFQPFRPQYLSYDCSVSYIFI